MIGRTISRYQIVEKLGEGGMGSVWLAEDPLLERKVAMKFMSDPLSGGSDAHHRFLREARAACSLSHPGIAAVFDAGEDETDGTVFIAFELVNGETVADLAHRERISVGRALRLAREAADALGHAHSKGILHRDVTARNIMVNSEGKAIVVDFGLALPEGETRITRTGSTVGTVGYLAPEVARGQPGDRRSDLYGLGAVLYEMLTGRLPFEADRPAAVLYAVVNEPADPPSRHREGLPEAVDNVLLRTLAKNPEHRYQTMEELVADLTRLEQGEEIEAPEGLATTMALGSEIRRRAANMGTPAPPRSRIRQWGTRAGIAVAALVVAGWLLDPLGVRESSSALASVAVLPLQNGSPDSTETDHLVSGLGDALATKLGKVGGLQVTPWITSQRYLPTGLPLKEIARELGVDHLVVGSFRKWENRIQVNISVIDGDSEMQTWADSFEELASDYLSVQKKAAVALAGQLKGTLTGEDEATLEQQPTNNFEAFDFYLRGAAALQGDNRESKDRALAYFDRAVQLDPGLADAYVGRGAVHNARYFFGWGGGARSLELAEENHRKALELDPDNVNARRGLIRVFYELGKSEECLKLGAEARADDTESIGHLLAQAEGFVFAGFSDLAVPLLERVQELDPANEGAHFFGAVARAWAGQFDDAIDAGEEFFRKFGEDPEVHLWVGVAYHQRRELDRALVHCERAVELFGEDSNHYVYHHLGALYSDLDREDDARATWEAAARMLEPRVEAYPDNGRMRSLLAALYARLGDEDRFRRELEGAMEHLPTLGPTLSLCVASHVALGNVGEAAQLLLRAIELGCIRDEEVGGAIAPQIAHALDDPEFAAAVEEERRVMNSLRARYAPKTPL